MKKMLVLLISIPCMFIAWYCYGMGKSQYSGNIYSCIDMKIEYGHINPNNLKEVIDFSNEITSRTLTFSTKSEYKGFDKLSLNKETKTHCVYYARTYKKVFDYIISKGNLKATCEIRREPIKGLGFIPKFFKSIGDTRMYNFTKDHDYCVVNGIIVVDPTVYDFLH